MAAMHDTSQPSAATVPAKGKPSRKLIWFGALILCLLVAGGFVAGYLPKRRTTQQLNAAAEKRRNDPPFVNSAKVKRAAKTSELLLPGNITPITEAYIFARASGYLIRRYVDIGDRVAADQLLAEIDAPDLDQQVSQARAAVAQAESQLGQAEATLQQLIATRDLAAITWQRYKVLTASGAVSRQDGDMQSTAAKTAEANVTAGEKSVHAAAEFVRASKAELQRLVTLQGYERITAPFAGIITARNVDVGALISATGSSQGPARPSGAAPSDVPAGGEIFRVAEIGKLRILVSLPQMYLPTIQVGQAAKVTVQERPNLSFPGKVTRTSSSLDAASRTLLTEVQVDNPTGVLLPGMYALLQFVATRNEPPFLVPDASLVVRATGTMLAVLNPLTGEDLAKTKTRVTNPADLAGLRKVQFVAVQPGRDYGTELEILHGLQGGEEVVVDPGDAVREGAVVQTLASNSAKQTSSSKPGNK
jgi:multidrug efflux pump subunit AcrA (membrane-fusion protein)